MSEAKMTDDLVKRLRNPIGAMRPTLTDGREAADRIEELEAKQKKAAEYFTKIILHCANFGRGVPSIDERIIERCEDTAANAIEELAGGKDE